MRTLFPTIAEIYNTIMNLCYAIDNLASVHQWIPNCGTCTPKVTGWNSLKYMKIKVEEFLLIKRVYMKF